MDSKDYLERACDSYAKWGVLAVNEELGLVLLKDKNRVVYVVDATNGCFMMPYHRCLAQQELYCYAEDCPQQDAPCVREISTAMPHKLMALPLTNQEMNWLRHQDIYDLVRSVEG